MPRLTVAQRAELATLHAETVAVVDWFVRHQGFPYADAVKQLADEARDKQQLGAMRSIARQMRGVFNELPVELSQQIVSAVEAESGVKLAARFQVDAAEAEAILTAGVVRARAEYDTLRTFVEQLGSDPARADDVKRALAILDGYTGSDEAAT